MDSRQSMSMMGPPGYPHMPPMNSTGPTMTGDLKPQKKNMTKESLTVTVTPRINCSLTNLTLIVVLSRTPCTDEPAAHDTYQKLPDASHAS